MSSIRPKRSNSPGQIPALESLTDGEFAINSADKIIYQRVGGLVVAVSNYSVGGAGNPWNSVTVNLPPGISVMDHEQVFTNVSVSPSSKIILMLDPGTGEDENQPEGLWIITMAAYPTEGAFLLVIEFGEPTKGPVKLFYQVN